MSRDTEGEQTELGSLDGDTESKTIQEHILSRYKSNDLFDTAVGFWSKLLVEAFIVAAPLAVVILIPGVALAWFGIGPITYANTALTWITFSTTIVAFVWCFIDVETEDEIEDS